MGVWGQFGGKVFGTATATAGTVVNILVPPTRDAITRVTQVRYTAAATAHTVTALRSIGTTTAAATAAISQAVVNLTANPGPSGNALAANDWVAIRHSADGITRLYQVSSISTLAVTMTANFTVAVAAGDKVWMFGVAADTDPRTATAHPGLAMGAAATTTFTDDNSGVACGHAKDEPVLLQSNNATNAGTFNLVTAVYTAN